MRRRDFFGGVAAGLAFTGSARADCLCALAPALSSAASAAGPFDEIGSKVRITGMKAIGVSTTPNPTALMFL